MSSSRVQIRCTGTPIALSDGIYTLAAAQKVPFMVQPRHKLGKFLLQQPLGDSLHAIRDRHFSGPWAEISTRKNSAEDATVGKPIFCGNDTHTLKPAPSPSSHTAAGR
jgi:hypothetical protein